MLVIKQKIIKREDLRNNRNLLYVFGDNLERVGMGGQAYEMRGEPNAFGIATKFTPGHSEETDYFSDCEECERIIDEEFSTLYTALVYGKVHYHGIVLPADGLGTGLAELKTRAPKLLLRINKHLESIKDLVETPKV